MDRHTDTDGAATHPVPWWHHLTLEEREEQFGWAEESWHERYAEAGSSWVFGGGTPYDANLAAAEGAGRRPQRADFGLPPEEPPVHAPHDDPDWDDDVPF